MRLRDRRYLVVLAVLALAAFLLGGAIPHAAFFLWIGAGVVDLAWAWLSVRQIGIVYRAPAGTVTAGDGLPVELHLDNDGWLPCVAVTLRDGPEARVRFSRSREGEVLSLGSFDGFPQLRRQLAAVRGRYRLGPLELIAGGPFGIAESRRRIWSERTITVLPRLKALPAWPARRREPMTGQSVAVSLYTDPAQVGGVRPLLPSDPPRHIHWKRSARTGHWQVREMEPAAGGATLLVLDLQHAAYAAAAAGVPHPEGAVSALCDDAVEIAAAIANAALSRGDRLAFAATGHKSTELPYRRGSRAAGSLLEALAQAQADGTRPLAGWLERDLRRLLGPVGATVVVVTPAEGAAWAPSLAAIRRLGAEPMAVHLLPPGSDRAKAAERATALRRQGIVVWAAQNAEDLARAMRGGRSLATVGDRVGAGFAGGG